MSAKSLTTNFDFMGHRKLAACLSLTLITVAIVALVSRGLSFGIDFTGGTLVEIGYEQVVDLGPIRDALTTSEFGDAIVQYFGSPRDVLIRLASSADAASADISTRVLEVLPGAEMRRIEFVGPQVGEDLTEDGTLAMLYALGGILLYVTLRFQYKFALGAVAALVHDVIITLGFFAVLGIEFDLPVLAAILAVIGYSLNDTIVVFDRIRENFHRMRKGSALNVINVSINQTLSRTLMTAFTTLVVLLALFFLGGELIHAFATALIVGIVVGTYSSIYIASTIALALGVSRTDLIEAKKDEEADVRP